jgi:hypothetical protein
LALVLLVLARVFVFFGVAFLTLLVDLTRADFVVRFFLVVDFLDALVFARLFVVRAMLCLMICYLF